MDCVWEALILVEVLLHCVHCYPYCLGLVHVHGHPLEVPMACLLMGLHCLRFRRHYLHRHHFHLVRLVPSSLVRKGCMLRLPFLNLMSSMWVLG